MGLQVRKINDDNDNKGASELTSGVHSESCQTFNMEIFLKQSEAEIH